MKNIIKTSLITTMLLITQLSASPHFCGNEEISKIDVLEITKQSNLNEMAKDIVLDISTNCIIQETLDTQILTIEQKIDILEKYLIELNYIVVATNNSNINEDIKFYLSLLLQETQQHFSFLKEEQNKNSLYFVIKQALKESL